MSERKNLTVKEVAELTGLTRQAIYKRMDKDFQPFVIELNGRKYLKSEVLTRLNLTLPSTKVDSKSSTSDLEKLVEHLEKENERLLAEIAELKQQLSEEREQNRQNAAELRSLSVTVGDSLRHITMGQAAAETQQLVDKMQQQAPIEQPIKRRWWQRKPKGE
jgi:predicted DNA-binding transcriptional regulator AlpA